MHKRLMTPVLQAMDPDRVGYFQTVVDDLDGDDRIARNANIVFQFLAEAAPFLPIQLPKRDLIGRLITFVERNQHRIVKTMYDPQFLADKNLMKPVVAEFVQETTAQVMLKMEQGDIDADTGNTVIKLSWPINPADFPYVDEEEDLDD